MKLSAILALGALLASGIAISPARSAAQGLPPAPERPELDENMIDVWTGGFQYSHTDLSIGEKSASGLQFTRYFSGAAWRNNLNVTNTLTSYYDDTAVCSSTNVASVGNITESFCESLPSDTGDGAGGGGSYFADGTTFNYGIDQFLGYAYDNGTYSSPTSSSDLLFCTQIKHPDGTTWTFHYKSAVIPSGVTLYRVQSVTTNTGYQLKLTYVSNNPGDGYAWGQVSGVAAINNSVEYCDPNADSCSYVNNWASTSYSGSPVGMSYYKDPLGKQYQYYLDSKNFDIKSPLSQGYNIAYSLVTMTDPCPQKIGTCSPGSLESAVSNVSYLGVVTSYGYSYNNGNSIDTVTATGPYGSKSYTHSPGGGGVNTMRDELGRVSSFTYDAKYGRMLTATYPEGNKTTFIYDNETAQFPSVGRGNVTQQTVTPKPGSGQASISGSSAYAADCVHTSQTICNEPLSRIDANQNATTYTYDPAHGGVLTQTSAPDANGVQAQIRYGYQQFYAKVLNSSGQLVNADTPIYKLTSVSSCRSAVPGNPASCVGTANELVKTYTYNSNNLLLTSEMDAAGDGSMSATTSYAYDNYGNRVMVDGPRTDVDDRSYTTYDLLRRPVFEIGVDPDGSGPLPRRIVHHIYDDDGNEIQTETGTGSTIVFDSSGVVPIGVSDFTVVSFVRNTYDPATERLMKSEIVTP